MSNVEKVKLLEGKLRMSQAQLRMSKINVDTAALSQTDIFKANLLAEIGRARLFLLVVPSVSRFH